MLQAHSLPRILSLLMCLGMLSSENTFAADPPEESTPPATAKVHAIQSTEATDESRLHLEACEDPATVTFLSWDTEGGHRGMQNLLRSGVSLKASVRGSRVDLQGKLERHESDTVHFRLAASEERIDWTVRIRGGGLMMNFRSVTPSNAEHLELVLPFNPQMAATTVLPAGWEEDGSLRLPAVLSAPDFGQMLLTSTPCAGFRGHLRGSRRHHTLDFILEMPVPQPGESVTLELAPLRLPPPPGLSDPALWPAARRGWFNALQPSAEWGDAGNSFSAPAGILANNVLSDPVSCLLGLWADHVLLTPDFSPDIRLADLVRRTLDWWLDHRTRPSGEVVAYWDYAGMLDANASPLIAAWDYVEASGDRVWLARRIEHLERIADYLASRDVDDDGLVESLHSGNYGTLHDPQRADSAYDTINAGHKNAYCNALAYRAFRCLADLEKQLQRVEPQARYTRCADRIQAIFFSTFYNPQTGWLAWWQSEDGELHDLASPMISSLSICYGLVAADQRHEILERLWAKLEAVGFRRFDLGVPITLIPVRRGDYLLGKDIPGAPQQEDGSDTFGEYLNGGCLVSDAVYLITALHMAGDGDRGDQILRAMLARQEKGAFPNGGGFQNGVVNAHHQGAEFYTWDGATCGYEGHLTYSYSFLQALLLRQPSFRARLYRPLMSPN